jgi:hypothetical protein
MRGFAELARDTCKRLEVSTVIEIGNFYITDSPHRRRYWITSCLPGAHIEYRANSPGRCFWKTMHGQRLLNRRAECRLRICMADCHSTASGFST